MIVISHRPDRYRQNHDASKDAALPPLAGTQSQYRRKLFGFCLMASWNAPPMTKDALVAQLDRALPSEGRGHRFESCRVRHNFQQVSASCFYSSQRWNPFGTVLAQCRRFSMATIRNSFLAYGTRLTLN